MGAEHLRTLLGGVLPHSTPANPLRTSDACTTMSAVDTLELLDFACPRCGLSVHEEFYGPCATCVDELRARVRLDKTDVEVADYVPKMNVTPNAVASKE